MVIMHVRTEIEVSGMVQKHDDSLKEEMGLGSYPWVLKQGCGSRTGFVIEFEREIEEVLRVR